MLICWHFTGTLAFHRHVDVDMLICCNPAGQQITAPACWIRWRDHASPTENEFKYHKREKYNENEDYYSMEELGGREGGGGGGRTKPEAKPGPKTGTARFAHPLRGAEVLVAVRGPSPGEGGGKQ